MTLDQATAALEQARTSPIHAYVVLSIMTGVRTEEARALRWDHVVAWVDDATGWQPVAGAGFDHKKVRGLRVAVGSRRRRYQHREVAPDAGSPRRSG
jgi:integrase